MSKIGTEPPPCDNKKTLPPNAEKLDVLNPYAVLLRYDFIDVAQGFDEPLRARLYYRCAHGRRSRLPLSERSPCVLVPMLCVGTL